MVLFRGPGFNSKNPHGVLQPSLTPGLMEPMLLQPPWTPNIHTFTLAHHILIYHTHSHILSYTLTIYSYTHSHHTYIPYIYTCHRLIHAHTYT